MLVSADQPGIPPALDAVVMRALAKEPGERFQNADAFIAALDQAMREPGIGGGTAAFAALPPVVAEEVVEEEPEPSRRWLWIGLAIAAVIGILIGLLLTRDTSTEVPSVTGRQLGEAEQKLERQGFKVTYTAVERQAPKNTVLEQDPLPGNADEECAFLTLFCSKPTVELTVSAGPGSGKVPSTAELPLAEAEELLEEAEFNPVVERRPSDSVEEGLVIFSEPGGGEAATHGSDVTLFVSSGPRQAKVPVLVGKQRRVAVQEIRALGLVPSVSEEEARNATPGEVISQSPSAGRQVEQGATVAIVVARAVKQATVPNVIGKERREAVERVREKGLVPVVEEEETEVESQIGRVLDQFPPPKEEVEPGSEVTLVVGKRAQAFPEEGEETG